MSTLLNDKIKSFFSIIYTHDIRNGRTSQIRPSLICIIRDNKKNNFDISKLLTSLTRYGDTVIECSDCHNESELKKKLNYATHTLNTNIIFNNLDTVISLGMEYSLVIYTNVNDYNNSLNKELPYPCILWNNTYDELEQLNDAIIQLKKKLVIQYFKYNFNRY